MTPTSFNQGMDRLRNQWPGAYGEERSSVFWASFRDVSSSVWTDAVTEVLAVCRAAPLLPELERAVEASRLREKEKLAHRGDSSATEILNRRATSEFAKSCMDALEYKRKKNLKHDSPEWREILIMLGKACGMTERQATERPPQ